MSDKLETVSIDINIYDFFEKYGKYAANSLIRGKIGLSRLIGDKLREKGIKVTEIEIREYASGCDYKIIIKGCLNPLEINSIFVPSYLPAPRCTPNPDPDAEYFKEKHSPFD